MTPENLLIALIGCFVGTIVGLLPGLGPINGVAILLPLAFALHLPAESALILLATVYIGCEYGGRISSILLNVPGDAAAIMTALDGYPMAQQGRGGVALSISAVSSFFGSLIAIGGIILFAPLLAQWSLAFGPAEYFALMVFAIACLGSMMAQNPLKSFLAALIGLGGDGGRGCQHRGLPLHLRQRPSLRWRSVYSGGYRSVLRFRDSVDAGEHQRRANAGA